MNEPTETQPDPTETPLEGTAESVAREQQEVAPEVEPDPVDAAIQAALEVQRESLRAEVSEQLKSEFAASAADARRKSQEDAEQVRLRDSFGTAVREARQSLSALKFYGEDGLPISVDDAAFQAAVVQPFQKHNAVAYDAASYYVLSALAEAATKLLPSEMRESFNARAKDKDLAEWLTTFVEHTASSSNWARQEATKLKAATEAAEARGYKRGQAAPAGVPRPGSARAPAPTVDTKSHTGIAKALGDGLLTNDEALKHWRALGP